jgi:hypothetical protein
VATTIARARTMPVLVVIRCTGAGPSAYSIASASTVNTEAPARSACSRIRAISSGPSTPSGKPGKFSTMPVSMSWPPGAVPASTTGSVRARAR